MRDSYENVAQIGERVDAVAFAGRDQREQDGGAMASVFASNEEPVLAADGDAAQCAFGGVVIRLQRTVFNVARQRRPLSQTIVHGLAQRAFRQRVQTPRFQPFVDAIKYRHALQRS